MKPHGEFKLDARAQKHINKEKKVSVPGHDNNSMENTDKKLSR